MCIINQHTQNEKIHKRGRYSAEFKEKVALEALSGARTHAQIASDYGSQYTSEDWQKAMQSEGIQISMDGKGRWADNIIMEHFWRTYKHEFFLHREPRNLEEAIVMTSQWLEYYNKERPHSALGLHESTAV